MMQNLSQTFEPEMIQTIYSPTELTKQSPYNFMTARKFDFIIQTEEDDDGK